MLKLDVGIWRTKELPSGVIKLGQEILIKGWVLWQSYLQIEEFPLPWFDDTGGYSLAPAFSSSRPRSTAAALTTDSVKRSQAPRVRKSKSPKLKPDLGGKKFYFQTTCPRHLTSCWYSMRCCNSSVFLLKIDPVTDQSSGGSLVLFVKTVTLMIAFKILQINQLCSTRLPTSQPVAHFGKCIRTVTGTAKNNLVQLA